jgi:hypothetical protein
MFSLFYTKEFAVVITVSGFLLLHQEYHPWKHWFLFLFLNAGYGTVGKVKVDVFGLVGFKNGSKTSVSIYITATRCLFGRIKKAGIGA